MQQQGLEAAAAQVALLGDAVLSPTEVQQYSTYQVQPEAVQGEDAAVQAALNARIQQHLAQQPAAPAPVVPPTPEQMQMHYITNRYMADLQQQAQARRAGSAAAAASGSTPPLRGAAATRTPSQQQLTRAAGKGAGVSESDVHLQPGPAYN
jgi:hypothetical protein